MNNQSNARRVSMLTDQEGEISRGGNRGGHHRVGGSHGTNVCVTKDDTEHFQVRYDGFAVLPTVKQNNNFVYSPPFACFGHRWRLCLFPGGHVGSDDGMVDVVLNHLSEESIEVEISFIVKGAATAFLDNHTFQPYGSQYLWGTTNFAKRSSLACALKGGALVVEVLMRQVKPQADVALPFVPPENPLCKIILNKFMDEKSSDVVFEVADGHEQGYDTRGSSKKRTKTSTTFYAHRFILQECTSALGELCKSGGDGDSTSIPITDVKPDVFRHLLHYIYGGKISDKDLKANAEDIIDAADKYGVVMLKLEAEGSYVTSTTITMDNVIDTLLYADSKNCALLKEAAMDFIVENVNEAIKKVNFQDVPGSVIPDLLAAMNMGKKEVKAGSTGASDFSALRVNALRKMLYEKGLDIDGSRETMIALLEENSSN